MVKKCYAKSVFLHIVGIVAVLPVLGAGQARANLMIMPVYGVDITPAARTVIDSAIKFYTDNFTGNTSVVLGFGLQPGGGASATQYNNTFSYTSVLTALKANQTESATDVSALASLPATAPIGKGQVQATSTLAAQLGLRTPMIAAVWTGDFCSGTMNACIAYNPNYISGGKANGPADGLFGVTQHEINEVLGTPSALTGSVTPDVVTVADLFRYAAAGVRSFSTNASSPGGSCATNTPVAYLSVNGGTTNLVGYNNCANGGDYGDFAIEGTRKPQDYASNESNPSALTLSSSETLLLDAAGWNIGLNAVVAVGSLAPTDSPVLGTSLTTEGGADDGDPAFAIAVPEPGTLTLLGVGLAATTLRGRRKQG